MYLDIKFGDIDLFDFVSIKYIEKVEYEVKMEVDKDYLKVEKFYGEVIWDLIWIEGWVVFVNLKWC